MWVFFPLGIREDVADLGDQVWGFGRAIAEGF